MTFNLCCVYRAAVAHASGATVAQPSRRRRFVTNLVAGHKIRSNHLITGKRAPGYGAQDKGKLGAESGHIYAT